MTKFEKILLIIDIILFIVGAIAFSQDSKIWEQVSAYLIVVIFIVTAILIGSGFNNSKGNIFDNHTNINITIHDSDKKD